MWNGAYLFQSNLTDRIIQAFEMTPKNVLVIGDAVFVHMTRRLAC